MKAQTIDVKQSTGRILCCTIFRAGGKKLLAKGHVISEEDARMLETEGMNEVWVTELEEGEIGEDDAVMQVASEIGCGSLEIRLAAGGGRTYSPPSRVASWWTMNCLKQINCTASMAIATSLNFSYARAANASPPSKALRSRWPSRNWRRSCRSSKNAGPFCRPGPSARRPLPSCIATR